MIGVLAVVLVLSMCCFPFKLLVDRENDADSSCFASMSFKAVMVPLNYPPCYLDFWIETDIIRRLFEIDVFPLLPI